MATIPPILKGLFSSKLRVKVLSHLFSHPGETFHVRGIAEILSEPAGTVARELSHLERSGILASTAVGNQKHYSLRDNLSIAEELARIFLKTTGAGEQIRAALQRLTKVELAFIYGSFAAGDAHATSDFDLMVVGRVSNRELAPVISRIERRLGREINYTFFRRKEIEKRLGREGDFVHEVFVGPKILLIGDMGDELLATAE
jgi:predicted nucleotidyltransferase